MRTTRIWTVLTLAITACSSSDSDPAPADDPVPVRQVDPDGMVQTFADEFDGDTLDARRWFVRSGVTHSKTLSQSSPDMASLAGGSLFLAAQPSDANPALPFSAAYIDTDGVFAQTYGRFEMRARGDYAPGLWYALWGRPWSNAVPELDIEFLAEDTTQVWLVNHWGLPPVPADQRRQFVTVNGLDVTQFHLYTVEWTPDAVEWRIDGKSYFKVTGQGVPHEPIFWVMNVWVGGWAGTPGPSTKYPSHFEVDWFHAHRLAQWATDPQIRVRNRRDRYSVGDVVRVELADFDTGARVEVWEGDKLLTKLTKPPFWFSPRGMTKTHHEITFVGTDGDRRATTTLPMDVY